MLGVKRLCRVRIAKDELDKMSKEDLRKSWQLQEDYLDFIEAKMNENPNLLELTNLRESEEKLKHQQFETTRRENILVMRLTTKEQEMQEYASQIQELKQAQIPSTSQLRSVLLDPAINLMFEKMKKEIETLKKRLGETQDELTAWKFTPDSNTGKRLMAKCRLLYQENEELGRTLSSGKFAKLEGDLALQKSFSEEMKKSQLELDEFVMELDEDVEGMQSTIYYLQQQLREAKDRIGKLAKENEKLSGLSYNHLSSSTETIKDNKSLPALDVKQSKVSPPKVPCVKSPPSSPDNSLNADRTAPVSNCKPNVTTQLWAPTPSEKGGKVEVAPPPPHPSLNADMEKLQIKVEVEQNNLSPEQPSPQSVLIHSADSDVHPVSNQLTVATACGSLHMEEYDSEQDADSLTPGEECGSTNAFSTKSCDQHLSAKRTNSDKKVADPVGKRTSENGARGKKRTGGGSKAQPRPPIEGDAPSVKRLRRRDIVVERDISDSEHKRAALEIDTDTEVQVAQTLAQWAATNKERKDIHNNLAEAVGNGELKASKLSEKMA